MNLVERFDVVATAWRFRYWTIKCCRQHFASTIPRAWSKNENGDPRRFSPPPADRHDGLSRRFSGLSGVLCSIVHEKRGTQQSTWRQKNGFFLKDHIRSSKTIAQWEGLILVFESLDYFRSNHIGASRPHTVSKKKVPKGLRWFWHLVLTRSKTQFWGVLLLCGFQYHDGRSNFGTDFRTPFVLVAHVVLDSLAMF